MYTNYTIATVMEKEVNDTRERARSRPWCWNCWTGDRDLDATRSTKRDSEGEKNRSLYRSCQYAVKERGDSGRANAVGGDASGGKLRPDKDSDNNRLRKETRSLISSM